MTELRFTTIGIPAPQGSKNRFGGEDNPRTKPWRLALAADAQAAGATLMDGPLTGIVYFYFPRPKGHYRTGKHAGQLRPDAPMSVGGKPDLDKLLRAVGDALTGVAYRDDAQIASWVAFKRYGEPARAEVLIREAVTDEAAA